VDDFTVSRADASAVGRVFFDDIDGTLSVRQLSGDSEPDNTRADDCYVSNSNSP
jgi:hypothetical protein